MLRGLTDASYNNNNNNWRWVGGEIFCGVTSLYETLVSHSRESLLRDLSLLSSDAALPIHGEANEKLFFRLLPIKSTRCARYCSRWCTPPIKYREADLLHPEGRRISLPPSGDAYFVSRGERREKSPSKNTLKVGLIIFSAPKWLHDFFLIPFKSFI